MNFDFIKKQTQGPKMKTREQEKQNQTKRKSHIERSLCHCASIGVPKATGANKSKHRYVSVLLHEHNECNNENCCMHITSINT